VKSPEIRIPKRISDKLRKPRKPNVALRAWGKYFQDVGPQPLNRIMISHS
jgi:hypothetical protein